MDDLVRLAGSALDPIILIIVLVGTLPNNRLWHIVIPAGVVGLIAMGLSARTGGVSEVSPIFPFVGAVIDGAVIYGLKRAILPKRPSTQPNNSV